MCPGLTSKGGDMQTDVEESTYVALFAEGKEHALAIGYTKLSAHQMWVELEQKREYWNWLMFLVAKKWIVESVWIPSIIWGMDCGICPLLNKHSSPVEVVGLFCGFQIDIGTEFSV